MALFFSAVRSEKLEVRSGGGGAQLIKRRNIIYLVTGDW